MKCQHEIVNVQIIVERWIDATIGLFDARIDLDQVATIKVRATCADCKSDHRYNAYSPKFAVAYGYGTEQGKHWPIWLRERMFTIAKTAPVVAEALQACRVPDLDI